MLIKYDLAVTGRENVDRALASIERRFAVHNQRVSRMTGGASTSSARVARSPAAAADREARQQETYWQRAAQRSADYRIRQEQRVHNATMRNAAREDATRRRDAIRNVQFQARQERKAAHAQERQALAHAAARQRFGHAAFGTVSGSVGNSLRAVGGLGMTALSLGGGFAMAGAIGAQMQDSKRAAMLANQAGDPALKGQLLREAQNVKGFTGAEALSGLEGFITPTGDLEAARKAFPELSRLALAYGIDLREMGDAAGQAFSVIRDSVQDPIEQMATLKDVMRTLAAQGTIGAIEMRDLAKELAGLGSASRAYQGDTGEMMKRIGAMAQAARARGGSASAAETTTAVVRFAQDLVKKPAQKALKGLGIDVFAAGSGNTKLNDPREIMSSILTKTGGDLTKLTGIMNAESIKALQGFSPLFAEAEARNSKLDPKQRLKKGEAGRAALFEEFARFEGASATDADIDARAASMLEEPAMRFKEVTKQFNVAVGAELLPAVTKLIPQFVKLLPNIAEAAKLLGEFMNSFVDDPLESVAKVIALKLAMDITHAGVAGAARDALTGVISRMTPPVFPGAPGGAPVPGGRGGKGFGAIAGQLAPAAALAGTYLAYDQYGKLKDELGKSAGNRFENSLLQFVPGMDKEGEFGAKEWVTDVGGTALTAMSGPAGLFDVMTGFGEKLKVLSDSVDVDKVVELQDADRASAQNAARQREASAAIAEDERMRQALVGAAKEAGQELISAAKQAGGGFGGLNRSNGPSPVKS